MCDCENGYLPINNIEGVVIVEGYDMEYIWFPTAFTPCFHCNPLSWSNEDLECVAV